MDRNKCGNCNLVNSPSEVSCLRCGRTIKNRSTSAGAFVRSPIYTVLAIVLVGWAAFFVYSGFEKSFREIPTGESNPLEGRPDKAPAPPDSRSEAEQKRIEPFKSAVQSSAALLASRKHVAEIQKIMGSGPAQKDGARPKPVATPYQE